MRGNIKSGGVCFRILIGFGWIFGILLPFYSLRRVSPECMRVFDWVFHTHASHVLMHAFLYAVLAWLVASFLRDRLRRRSITAVVLVVASVLAVAICQEAIQVTCEQLAIGADEYFDLFVDVTGGLLGTVVYMKWIRKHSGTACAE